MYTRKQRNRKNNRDLLITLGLTAVAVFIGYVLVVQWQNSVQVVETLDGNGGTFPSISNRALTNTNEPEPEPLETAEPNRIWIPDRNIETPIVYITAEQNNEDGHQKALENGVVHYPGTALPGQKGNPYIFGHSSDYLWKGGDYKEVFKELIDIPLETEVRITDQDGGLYIYRVIETKIVGPNEVSALDQANYERYLLTLQTSYPLGTALKRFLAICELDPEATFGPLDEAPAEQ